MESELEGSRAHRSQFGAPGGFRRRSISLFHQTEPELRKIFEFLQLSPDAYDYSAAQNLPVVGSSELAQQGAGAVHWRGVEKKAGFDLTRRWEHWSSDRNDRFLWIAGRVAERLGYSLGEPSAGRSWWTLQNRAKDALWRLKRSHR